MRSTDRPGRQRGSSVIEALVAAALLGITAEVAITSWNTAVIGASRATASAASRCLARAEMEAVLAAPFQAAGTYPAPPEVQVTAADGDDPGLQVVTVTATVEGSGSRLAALKSVALAGSAPVDTAAVAAGCPPP